MHGGGTVTLRVTGLPLPAKVSAVLLNVAVTNPTAAGVVVVFPHGSPKPATSNLNFVAGQTVANLVVVPVSAAGTVDLIVAGPTTMTTDLLADVSGYYLSGP